MATELRRCFDREESCFDLEESRLGREESGLTASLPSVDEMPAMKVDVPEWAFARLLDRLTCEQFYMFPNYMLTILVGRKQMFLL